MNAHQMGEKTEIVKRTAPEAIKFFLAIRTIIKSGPYVWNKCNNRPGEREESFWYLLVFERGSRGPSTVTFIALKYVVIWTGDDDTDMVKVKLLPAINGEREKENDVIMFFFQIFYDWINRF
jgi:hypothetical protein